MRWSGQILHCLDEEQEREGSSMDAGSLALGIVIGWMVHSLVMAVVSVAQKYREKKGV